MKSFKTLLDLLVAFLIFFVLCGFVVTISFLLFFQGLDVPEDYIRNAAVYTFINLVFITLLFVLIDAWRRRRTIDRPVRQITQALQKITAGDLSVQLDCTTIQPNFAQIMTHINHMTRELSGVETLRSDFIANVSHEMKTPLAVMQNYATMLQAPDLPEEKRLEYAKAVSDGSRRLADLMTNILKLNRLENQQIYPQATVYDLGEQLCQCLLQYESVWEQNNIAIDTDLADGITVQADEELLQHVWSNLFSNAFKFTAPGGTVSLRLTADTDWAVVSVTDTGCGMSPEVGAHIFEKFYQADTSRATAGNGLGLALVKRIIDITGGEISVSSSVGVGSTFTVRLRRNLHG